MKHILTAFRRGPGCGFEGEVYSKNDNLNRNKSLTAKLLVKGYGITRVIGIYPEGGVVKKDVGYFVADLNDSGELVKDVMFLGREFDQDSVMIILKGGEKAYFVGTNDCTNNELQGGKKDYFNKRLLGVSDKFYYTRVNGRPFVYKKVDEIVHPPGGGMGWPPIFAIAERHWTKL